MSRLDPIVAAVGPTGEYATMNKALTYLSSRPRSYFPGGVRANVLLLPGYQMAEQVIATHGIDLSWITILNSTTELVPIVREAIVLTSDDIDGMSYVAQARAAFMAGDSSRLPRLGCRMAMDQSGTAALQHGIFCVNRSGMAVAPGAGIDDATGLGAYVIKGSYINAPSTIWEGNGISGDQYFAGGIRADWNSDVDLEAAQVLDSLGQGVMINGGSGGSLRTTVIIGSHLDQLQIGGISPVHTNNIIITYGLARGIYLSEGASLRLLSGQSSHNVLSGLHMDQKSLCSSTGNFQLCNNQTYGARVLEDAWLHMIAPNAQGNTSGGFNADGGLITLTGSASSTGHGVKKDLLVNNGGRIKVTTMTTSSGPTAENNCADSNVTVLNVPRKSDGAMISRQNALAENQGKFTYPANATSFTLTHGILFNLRLEEVQARPQGANGWGGAQRCWVDNMTPTTVDVFLDPPPTVNVEMGWQGKRAH
jgi:hypothetical protein